MAIANRAEKAVSEQRDNLLVENHSMQETIHGLTDTVDCVRSELEKVQKEMAASSRAVFLMDAMVLQNFFWIDGKHDPCLYSYT